jgi:hypothetical protein
LSSKASEAEKIPIPSIFTDIPFRIPKANCRARAAIIPFTSPVVNELPSLMLSAKSSVEICPSISIRGYNFRSPVCRISGISCILYLAIILFIRYKVDYIRGKLLFPGSKVIN